MCFVEVSVLPRGRINWDIVSNEQLLGNNVQKAAERLKRTNEEEVGINGTRKPGTRCLLFPYETSWMYDMKRSRKFEDRWKLSWTIQEVISESFSKKQVFWDILLRFAKFYMIKSSWCNSAFRFSWISILFEGFLTCLLILEINKMMIDIYTSTIIINNYKTKSTDYLLI